MLSATLPESEGALAGTGGLVANFSASQKQEYRRETRTLHCQGANAATVVSKESFGESVV